MSWRTEQLSDSVTLYCGDCREILPTLGAVGRVITDPPYGQNYPVNSYFAGGTREKAVVQRNGATLLVRPNVHAEIAGDAEPFDPSHLLKLAPDVLIWGAHRFHERLPAGSWLVWDKVPTGKLRDQGDGEAAWINREQPLRIFRLLWDGLCVGAGARHEVTAGQKRLHPMQKPTTLMEWCIDQLGGGRGRARPLYGLGLDGRGLRAARHRLYRHRDGFDLFRHRLPAHRRRGEAGAAIRRAPNRAGAGAADAARAGR